MTESSNFVKREGRNRQQYNKLDDEEALDEFYNMSSRRLWDRKKAGLLMDPVCSNSNRRVMYRRIPPGQNKVWLPKRTKRVILRQPTVSSIAVSSLHMAQPEYILVRTDGVESGTLTVTCIGTYSNSQSIDDSVLQMLVSHVNISQITVASCHSQRSVPKLALKTEDITTVS